MKNNLILFSTLILLSFIGCKSDEPKNHSNIKENPDISSTEPIPKPHKDKPIKDKTDKTDKTEIKPAMPSTPSLKPAASPTTVKKQADYDTHIWSEIIDLDTSVRIDIKYATEDNFVKQKMYDCGRCFLRPEPAAAIAKAHQWLKVQGYGGLRMFDCYRPRPFQQRLWDKVPDDRFVTPPWKGSNHTRGAAVDLTIVDAQGKDLDMGTPYDFFGKEGYPDYVHKPKDAKDSLRWVGVYKNRKLLQKIMDSVGFKPIRTEWWHFDWKNKGANAVLSDWVWKCD